MGALHTGARRSPGSGGAAGIPALAGAVPARGAARGCGTGRPGRGRARWGQRSNGAPGWHRGWPGGPPPGQGPAGAPLARAGALGGLPGPGFPCSQNQSYQILLFASGGGQSLKNTPLASVLMRPSKMRTPSTMPQMNMTMAPMPQVNRLSSSCNSPREVFPR